MRKRSVHAGPIGSGNGQGHGDNGRIRCHRFGATAGCRPAATGRLVQRPDPACRVLLRRAGSGGCLSLGGGIGPAGDSPVETVRIRVQTQRVPPARLCGDDKGVCPPGGDAAQDISGVVNGGLKVPGRPGGGASKPDWARSSQHPPGRAEGESVMIFPVKIRTKAVQDRTPSPSSAGA